MYPTVPCLIYFYFAVKSDLKIGYFSCFSNISVPPILEYFPFARFQSNLPWIKVHLVGLHATDIFFLPNFEFWVPQKSKTQLKTPKVLKTIIMLECRWNFHCSFYVRTYSGTTPVLNVWDSEKYSPPSGPRILKYLVMLLWWQDFLCSLFVWINMNYHSWIFKTKFSRCNAMALGNNWIGTQSLPKK